MSTPFTNHGLFEQFIGAHEQSERYVDAERLGGLEVDDELDLGRLLHRQVGRLCAVENAPGVKADDPVGLDRAAAVADQATAVVAMRS